MQSLSTFLLFFGNQNNSESSIFFYFLINKFLWFAYLWPKFEERRTLRLFSMWTTPPPPPLLRFSLWFPYPLFSSAFHLVVAKILQTRTKFTQKLTPGFKNHMRNLDNFRQAVKNPKSWNSRHEFCPKNRFLQLIIADNLSNITFNYLYENSANSLCHFWNYKSFFTTKLLRIFLAQALHTFNKSSP